jgi:hypothetical protein
MMMVAPVPMGVAVVAPRVVAPMIVSVRSVIAPRGVASIIVSVTMGAVVPPVHHDDRRGSDDDGRPDTNADADVDTGLSRLRWRKQGESQEGDHTPHAYDMCKTFHSHILAVERQLFSAICRVIGSMLPPICLLVVHSV